MDKRLLAGTALSIVLYGCAPVGPDYTQPRATLQEDFVGSGSGPLANAAYEKWWLALNDPMLDHVVELGFSKNLDIAAAYENIRAAQANLRATGMHTQSTADFGAQATRSKAEGVAVSTTAANTLNANFVFDLFGGVRRTQEQANAQFEAAQFDAGTVRLAYLAELLDAYINARFFQSSSAVNRAAITSRRRTLSLVRGLREAGSATELEVQQARAQLSSAEAQLPASLAGFEENAFRIANLLAAPASPVVRDLKHKPRQPRPKGVGKIGLPADLVRNRPDIRAAERRLAAATAAIGIAEAQFYPSVSLTGSVTEGITDGWSFGPRLSMPLLNQQTLKANKDAAIAAARSAEIAWRLATLDAMRDVQIRVSQTSRRQAQVASLAKAARASQRVLSLSRESYSAGGILLTEVLDAERDNFTNQLALVAGRRDLALAWSQLQIAIGKGSAVEKAPASIAQMITVSELAPKAD